MFDDALANLAEGRAFINFLFFKIKQDISMAYKFMSNEKIRVTGKRNRYKRSTKLE